MRGWILFLALTLVAAGPHSAAAKPLPKAYGYGRVASATKDILDLRSRLPTTPEADRAALPPSVPSYSQATTGPAPLAAPPTATCYGREREGDITASGEAYDSEALAAAHPDMQLSSLALVRNTQNGREIIVRVNDRPRGNSIEFTPAAATALGLNEACAGLVTVTRLGDAPSAVKAGPIEQQAAAEPVSNLRAGSGAYLVQIGAFAQRDNAESARERAAAVGPVSVEPAIVGGTSLFRVRLGPWVTREEAEQGRDAAVNLGFPSAKLLLP